MARSCLYRVTSVADFISFSPAMVAIVAISRHSSNDFVKPSAENVFTTRIAHVAPISSREQVFVDSMTSGYEVVFDGKD